MGNGARCKAPAFIIPYPTMWFYSSNNLPLPRLEQALHTFFVDPTSGDWNKKEGASCVFLFLSLSFNQRKIIELEWSLIYVLPFSQDRPILQPIESTSLINPFVSFGDPRTTTRPYETNSPSSPFTTFQCLYYSIRSEGLDFRPDVFLTQANPRSLLL